MNIDTHYSNDDYEVEGCLASLSRILLAPSAKPINWSNLGPGSRRLNKQASAIVHG
jgi:hypothetical protein